MYGVAIHGPLIRVEISVRERVTMDFNVVWSKGKNIQIFFQPPVGGQGLSQARKFHHKPIKEKGDI